MPTITGDNSNNTLNGTSGDDEIYAYDGDDVIYPGDGNDDVDAGEGDDLIFWTGGSDTVDGGSGFDIVSLASLDDASTGTLADGTVIQGTLGGFTQYLTLYSIEGLVGTSGMDSFYWDEDTDETRNLYLDGGAGNDLLRGGLGDDTIFGGDGNFDFVESSRGNDTMDGGDGFGDVISYSGFDAEQGIVADLRTWTVVDEYGDTDQITGFEYLQTFTPFVDIIDGSESRDQIYTGGAGDTIRTHGGDDVINIEAAGYFDGGEGEDTIIFDWTGLRVDPLTDELGRDYIYRSAGVVLNLQTGVIAEDGFSNSGTVTNFENVIATDNDDQITGSDDANTLSARYGDDLVLGLGGDDILYGYYGNDRLFGGDGNDTVEGGSNTDYLFGDDGNDILRGGAGHDTLVGGAGNDEIGGDSGNNKMVGGAGADLFLIAGYGGAQVITDFNPLEDRIRFSADLGATEFADLTFIQDGKDLIIKPLAHVEGDSVRLLNTTLEMLNDWNFEFGDVPYRAEEVDDAPAYNPPEIHDDGLLKPIFSSHADHIGQPEISEIGHDLIDAYITEIDANWLV